MATSNSGSVQPAQQQVAGSSPALTRGLLEAGLIDALAASDDPAARLVTDGERLASLRETLALRPPGDVWVFGYGSLV